MTHTTSPICTIYRRWMRMIFPRVQWRPPALGDPSQPGRVTSHSPQSPVASLSWALGCWTLLSYSRSSTCPAVTADAADPGRSRAVPCCGSAGLSRASNSGVLGLRRATVTPVQFVGREHLGNASMRPRRVAVGYRLSPARTQCERCSLWL